MHPPIALHPVAVYKRTPPVLGVAVLSGSLSIFFGVFVVILGSPSAVLFLSTGRRRYSAVAVLFLSTKLWGNFGVHNYSFRRNQHKKVGIFRPSKEEAPAVQPKTTGAKSPRERLIPMTLSHPAQTRHRGHPALRLALSSRCSQTHR